ncbi:MAG: Uma2 family endonuclease [Gammaproteobacteria bacterium]|jgi:Uma2 family endonuclease
MSWAKICQDPTLRDLPYKIQTDKWGNIIMSPASNEHGIYQAQIIALISKLMGKGTIIAECSIQTSEGVKVADAAWATEKFIQKNKGNNPFDEAPEICVEILSPSNTEMEMEEKKELYFARGAKEFWICDKDGNIKFYKNTGLLGQSNIIKTFPNKL